jgi:transposase
MEVVVTHGAGLDVHKRRMLATVITPTVSETRTFGTLTVDLLALADWLTACGVTHVAMEATGVYGKPVSDVLEAVEGLTVWVVNPQTIKGMPGRKSDVRDSQWIASLLRIDALQTSVMPPRPQRELRELVRYRQSLGQERVADANRIQKILEGAHIKLASGISDLLGKSGTRRLQARAAGETDPAAWARLADARLRASPETLAAALQGLVGAHQQQFLRWQLQHVALLDAQIAAVSEAIATRLANFDDALTRLVSIPGVGRRTAAIIIAECGTDWQRFPTAAACVS